MTSLVVIVALAIALAASLAYVWWSRRAVAALARRAAADRPPGPGDDDRAVQPDDALAGTVLLVEDDEDVRASTVRILTRAGFEVLEASSAAAAIDVWRDQNARIDVVLSDVVMPGASGIELAAEITALSPGAAIILISGYTPSALERHRLLSGDSNDVQLLQKPLLPAELVAAIRDKLAPPAS